MSIGRQRILPLVATFAVAALYFGTAEAQPRGPAAPTRSARESAPVDLTGQWVSIVTEDWRFRMVTPPKGDIPGVSLTPAGASIASSWDPARDEAAGERCKAYGAAAIMRVPGRIRISWRDDTTLQIETDAGRQTRLLHFGPVADPAEPSLQGVSRAEWIPYGRGPGRPPVGGALEIVTTGLQEGYLRKNGVPYSGKTVLTEHFDVLEQPDGSTWLVVQTLVEDPVYHNGVLLSSSNFRKQTDRSGWDPQPCSAR
jgi:hypothetical protein